MLLGVAAVLLGVAACSLLGVAACSSRGGVLGVAAVVRM